VIDTHHRSTREKSLPLCTGSWRESFCSGWKYSASSATLKMRLTLCKPLWAGWRCDSILEVLPSFLRLGQGHLHSSLPTTVIVFVAGYFEIIRASAPHIYHSALVWPQKCHVRKLYESHSRRFARIICGVPESWDSNTAATTSPFLIGAAVWSPCNRFFAISSWDSIRVDILDSATLQRLQSLGSPWERFACSAVLIFSPDSRMLTYSGSSAHRTEPQAPYMLFDPEAS